MTRAGLPPRSDVKVPSTRLLRDIIGSLSQMWKVAIPTNAELYFRCPTVHVEFDVRSAGSVGHLYRSLGIPKNKFKLYYGFGVRQEPKLIVSTVEDDRKTKSFQRSKTPLLPVIKSRRTDCDSPAATPPRPPSRVPPQTTTGSKGGIPEGSDVYNSEVVSMMSPLRYIQADTSIPMSPPAPVISLRGQLSLSSFFQPIKSDGDSLQSNYNTNVWLNNNEDDLDYCFPDV
ncbi:hypothetical protein RCL1_003322 [Eukaryota sp. TZLM3-RCL]